MEAYQVKYRMLTAAKEAGCTDDYTNDFLSHAGIWADDVERLSQIALDRLTALYVIYAAHENNKHVTAAEALAIARKN